MFDPDHRNKTARRFCEWAECVFLGEHNMPNRRMAIYALASIVSRRCGRANNFPSRLHNRTRSTVSNGLGKRSNELGDGGRHLCRRSDGDDHQWNVDITTEKPVWR
jgi:hypothetical protein